MGMTQPEPALGLAIRRARERLHWTQKQLADEVGVSTRSVGNWELGHRVPRNRIGALEEVLGISLDGEPWGAAELTPTDEWEVSVLSDEDLPVEMRRQLIRDSRAARADYVRRKRELRATEARESADLSRRGRAAG